MFKIGQETKGGGAFDLDAKFLRMTLKKVVELFLCSPTFFNFIIIPIKLVIKISHIYSFLRSKRNLADVAIF